MLAHFDHFIPGTWLVLFRALNPTSPPPSLDSMPQRYEAADIYSAAKLGDIVLVRRLLARGDCDVRHS